MCFIPDRRQLVDHSDLRETNLEFSLGCHFKGSCNMCFTPDRRQLGGPFFKQRKVAGSLFALFLGEWYVYIGRSLVTNLLMALVHYFYAVCDAKKKFCSMRHILYTRFILEVFNVLSTKSLFFSA